MKTITDRDIRVSQDPDENWQNDAFQFPRLLTEITSVLRPQDYRTIARLMDLTGPELRQLFARAARAWEAIQAQADSNY